MCSRIEVESNFGGECAGNLCDNRYIDCEIAIAIIGDVMCLPKNLVHWSEIKILQDTFLLTLTETHIDSNHTKYSFFCHVLLFRVNLILYKKCNCYDNFQSIVRWGTISFLYCRVSASLYFLARHFENLFEALFRLFGRQWVRVTR